MPPTLTETVPAAPAVNGHYSALVVEDRVSIPSWVVNLATFRRWALPDEYPETGQFAYLAGPILGGP